MSSCVCVVVQRRRLPSWSLVERERWKCVRLQERRAQASGDLPIWAHHFLRRSAALHLQDHRGWERNVLWNTTGTSSFLYILDCACLLEETVFQNISRLIWLKKCYTHLYIFACLVVSWVTVCFVCTLAGWRDHKDHEGLHKHDREEALQCEVCIQLWHQLDQVIDLTGDQMYSATVHLTDNKKHRQMMQRWCFRAFDCPERVLSLETQKRFVFLLLMAKVGSFNHLHPF